MLDAPEQPSLPIHEPRRRRPPQYQRNDNGDQDVNDFGGRHKERRPKISRYTKEHAEAAERQAQVEAKNKAREGRDKDRKAMAKARRPGRDGKIKLGRQGNVLLGRVQRMIGEGKL